MPSIGWARVPKKQDASINPVLRSLFATAGFFKRKIRNRIKLPV